MPEVIIIGGANGAGKSTLARYTLPVEMPFLNADEIAKTLPDDYIGNREIASGRQLLERVNGFAKDGESFALEATLASRSLAPRLRGLKTAGYRVILFYVWSPNPELCVLRVAQRVLSRGHNIPEETIRRRYAAGLCNLFDAYLPLADEWNIYANDRKENPYLIASKNADGQGQVENIALWKQIQQQKEEYNARR